jgi:hypothetical protein
MNLLELHANKIKVAHTKIKIFTLLTQCLRDIDKTVTASGLTMRDVGIDVEKYITGEETYIIELKLHM